MTERPVLFPTDDLSREQLLAELARARAEKAALQQLLKSTEQTAQGLESRLMLLHRAIGRLPTGFVLADGAGRQLLNNGRHQAADEAAAPSLTVAAADDAQNQAALGSRDHGRGQPLETVEQGVDGGEPGESDDGWTRCAPATGASRLRQTIDGREIQVERQRFDDGYEVASLTDVSALRAAQKELKEALEQEIAENRAKSIFMANMSHELRNPLNAILGYAEFLLTDTGKSASEEKRAQYLSDIVFASRHLSAIINDILDLGSAETGQYRINLRDVPVRENLERVQRMFAARAAEQQVRLIVGMSAGDNTAVRADQRALNQMLINLVANSLRYTQANGAIVLECRLVGSGLNILVRDTGAGIAAEEIDNVLRPFQRGSNAESGENGPDGDKGLGLGLALTGELMKSHGGELSLESTVGQGTTVTLHFPEATPAENFERFEAKPAMGAD